MLSAKFHEFYWASYKSKDAYRYYRLGNNTDKPIKLGYLRDGVFVIGTQQYKYLNGEELQSMGYVFGRGSLRKVSTEGNEVPVDDDFGGYEEISITPLGIDADTKYKISNRTANYQEIDLYRYDSEGRAALIRMDPFSTIVMKSEEFMMSDFLELQKKDILRVENKNQTYNTRDWFKLKPLKDWFKVLTAKETDNIGKIRDNYYYRLTNESDEKITLRFPPEYNKYLELPKKGAPHNIQVVKGITLMNVGKEKIIDMYDNYLINLEALGLEKETNYKISNRAAELLTIKNYHPDRKAIDVPPFASRLMNSENLKWYDFLKYQSLDQIQIERTDQAYGIWDWIRLKPFVEWLKKLISKNADLIGKIKDNYYYRLNNKTDKDIELAISSQDGLGNTPFILPRKGNSQNTKVLSGITLNAMGKGKILDLVNSNLINFQPLEIKLDTDYRIVNRTEHRIGIMNYNRENKLVIPPLGTRLITSDKLKWYDFLEWYWQDLILVEPDNQSFMSSVGLSRIRDWIKLLPGLVLVGLAGIGIPLWIVFNFGGGKDLLDFINNNSMASIGKTGVDVAGLVIYSQTELAMVGLGRIFQVGFICIASILPALFYYLFGRQQVEKLREKFFRDVLVLDPHIYTLSGAEAKYDTLLNSAFGSGSSSSPLSILLLIFSTALLVTGWTLTLTPYGPPPPNATSLIQFFIIDPKPLTLGFLGVYFFSINMIFRRYVRADLTPKTYASIIVRLLVSLVLVFTIGVLDGGSASIGNGLLAVAFIIGVFPEDGFRMIRDSARKIVPGLRGGEEEKFPITELEGMNQYDQARLLEEGIENIENLAHHTLIDLLAFTRIPTARLVDMFDQAILYLHLGIFNHTDNKANGKSDNNKPDTEDARSDSDNTLTGKDLLKYLKSQGIRTATDLVDVLKRGNIDELKDSIDPSRVKLSRLLTIKVTLEDDECLSFFSTWKKESSRNSDFKSPIMTDPNMFFDLGAKDSDTLTNTSQSVQIEVQTGQPTDLSPSLPSSA